MLNRLLACSVGIALCACSSVTIQPEAKAKITTKPTYQESKSFFIFGLVGEHHINVTEICKGKEPLQMQSQQTFSDGLLTVLTLGIYAPHTAKVWCPQE